MAENLLICSGTVRRLVFFKYSVVYVVTNTTYGMIFLKFTLIKNILITLFGVLKNVWSSRISLILFLSIDSVGLPCN